MILDIVTGIVLALDLIKDQEQKIFDWMTKMMRLSIQLVKLTQNHMQFALQSYSYSDFHDSLHKIYFIQCTAFIIQ